MDGGGMFKAWCKRVESLLANVLAKANRGASAAVAMANLLEATNGAPVGPAATLTFAFNFTTKVGARVKVVAYVQTSIAGGTSVAGEVAQFALTQDGTPVAGSQMQVEYSAAHGLASATLTWVFNTVAGVSHSYGVQVTNVTTPSHTATIPTGAVLVQCQETLSP